MSTIQADILSAREDLLLIYREVSRPGDPTPDDPTFVGNAIWERARTPEIARAAALCGELRAYFRVADQTITLDPEVEACRPWIDAISPA